MISPTKASTLVVDYKKKLSIPLAEIMFLQGDINYTNFIFKHGRQHTVAHPLKYFEEILLGQGFLRIHRSYLVNSRFIKSTNLDDLVVVLMDGRELKVARRRRQVLG
jgi:two-component system, LytTR family, response regulator